MRRLPEPAGDALIAGVVREGACDFGAGRSLERSPYHHEEAANCWRSWRAGWRAASSERTRRELRARSLVAACSMSGEDLLREIYGDVRRAQPKRDYTRGA